MANMIPKSATEKAIDQNKKNKLYKVDGRETKREDIAAIVQAGCENLIVGMTRPKVNRNNLEEVQERTIEYLKRCIEAGRMPTMEGWAVFMGIGRTALFNWINDQSIPQTRDFLVRVRDSFAAMNAEAALDRKIDAVTWIFYSKNFYGMVDKSEVVLEPINPLDSLKDPSDIQKRLAEGIAED
jgi:hypothetical protein